MERHQTRCFWPWGESGQNRENSDKVGSARINFRNSRNRFLGHENIRKDTKHGGFRLRESSGKIERARIVSGIVAIDSSHLKIYGKTPNTVFLAFGRVRTKSGKVGSARIVSGIVAIDSSHIKTYGRTPNTVFLAFGRVWAKSG
ncbi:hypothetical protein NQ317_016556 [Molorchus minor]|uniref:Ribosomal protein S11 n=1 Tax=Molorchus minor TaxID=1323400 RepID=A0ABQ9IZK7_9CUCU|nr:hypothetical protein NQ317_016556 [Molorchus minor]